MTISQRRALVTAAVGILQLRQASEVATLRRYLDTW
jgi:hypothetical protein